MAINRFELSHRMEKLPEYYLAEIGKKIADLQSSGMDVIRLDIGSPDLPPHSSVIETLYHYAANPDAHGYQPHLGSDKLRQAWADYYARNYQVALDPTIDIVPTIGSKEGIFNLSQTIINPGDIALMPNPGYTTYERGTVFAGGEPYFMPLLIENDFLPDLDAIPLEVARRAKLMWLNYPNNPTAAVASREFFSRVISFAKEHDIIICHDAPYSQVYFADKPLSILQISGAKEVAIEFNSLSKSHNMAGWRVGAAVGNPQILKGLASLKVSIDSGHFLPILQAAITALNINHDWIKQRNDIYRERRDIVVQGLQKIGLSVRNPAASFYVWFSVPEKYTSSSYVTAMLEQIGVSISPGTVFGLQGEGFVRLSLTQPIERLQEAIQRIVSWKY